MKINFILAILILIVVIIFAVAAIGSTNFSPSQQNNPDRVIRILNPVAPGTEIPQTGDCPIVSCTNPSRTDSYIYSDQISLEVGDYDDLTARTTWENAYDGTVEEVDSNSFSLGSTSLITTSTTSYTMTIRHVDDSQCAPGSVTLRSFNVEEPASQGGSSLLVRGIESVGGGTTSLNAFEFSFDTPCGGFGLDLLDFESDVNFELGGIKAWDEDDVLIFQEDITTNGQDGVLFAGITDRLNRIKTVRVYVGDSNGGTLSDQLACTNFRIATHNEITTPQVQRTITSVGTIQIVFEDLDTNMTVTDPQIINGLIPI